MQSEQIINILHIGFIICLVLTILFAALSVFFFFQFKIRDVFNAITGRAQRKSVQQMEEENAKTGKLRQDYYSAPTSSDLYTTPSGRIPPVMSAQQAAGGQADGAAYTEQVYHSADPEGREHTMQLHTAQQAASDNGGSEATTLLNGGSEETTLLNSGSEETTLLNSGSEETTLLNSGSEETTLLNSGSEETTLLNGRNGGTAAQRNAGFGETTLLTPEMETSFVQAKTNEKPEWNFVIKKEIMEIHTNEIV